MMISKKLETFGLKTLELDLITQFEPTKIQESINTNLGHCW
jgi:hypothetical protein